MAVVAIHIGAGYHAPQEEEAFREMLDRIITKLRASLCNGNAALDLVHEGLTLLENDEMTNAGLGSCLTIDGYVEMDALIIDGASGAIGAVGAVSDVRNPSSIAYKLIREQQLSDHILIPTILICGLGARAYAEDRGLEYTFSCVEKVLERYREVKERYDQHCKVDFGQCKDTVGVICIDKDGNAAAGVSTGGRWLKPRGRIGDSAIYGAGAHVHQTVDKSPFTFASSTTGTGEHLIQTMLARSQCDALLNDDEGDCTSVAIKKHFLKAQGIIKSEEKGLGFISLIDDGAGMIELWIGHTTHSLGYAYASSSNKFIEISRKSSESSHKLQCISIKK